NKMEKEGDAKTEIKLSHVHLTASFLQFCSKAAFFAYKDNQNYLPLNFPFSSSWFNLEDKIKEDSTATFQKRLSTSSNRRKLLTLNEYCQIKVNQVRQFLMNSPLQKKSWGFEFTHKSFFEFFWARILLAISPGHQNLVEFLGEILSVRNLSKDHHLLSFFQ